KRRSSAPKRPVDQSAAANRPATRPRRLVLFNHGAAVDSHANAHGNATGDSVRRHDMDCSHPGDAVQFASVAADQP
ncbi:MAG: hypothetical protein ABI886_17160, partial [Betaproteobacteria bacterium]